jgi:hypothetical protein
MPIPRLHKETPLYSTVKTVGAYLKLLADSIVSLVQMDETYVDPSGNRVTNHAASLIKQNADNILLRVEKNGVISSINQSSEQIKINAAKVNIAGDALFTTGALSKVVRTTNTQWYSSTSRTALAGGTWVTTQPTITARRYLWQREYVTYSNGDTEYKPSEGGVCVTPDTDAVKSVVVEYAQNQSRTSAPTGASDWSATAPTWREGYYIWTRTKTVTGSGTSYTTPVCISGADGANAYAYDIETQPAALVRDKNGTISPTSITFYAKRAYGSTYTDYAGRFIISEYNGSSWSNKYTSSGNESSKAYSPTSTAKIVRCNLYMAGGTSTLVDSQSVPIASDGATGDAAYTVLLTNESHTFAAGTSAAVAGLATTNVIAYKGSTRKGVTVGTVTGAPTGMTVSVSSNGTTAPTISVNVTTSLTTRSGTLTIPVTVDGNAFTLVFSWSLALTGATGQTGKGVKKLTEQYYLSTSNTTQTGGSWTATPANYVSGRYYWTRVMVEWSDNTTTYTDPVLANGLNGSLTLAHGAYNNGAAREQYIWFSAVSGTNSLSANTTWVTRTDDVQNQWTAIRPTFSWSYPVVFRAKQTQTVAQLSGTACSCTTPVKDTTTTHIDGAQIVTGIIDCEKVTLDNLNASWITTGKLSAGVIDSGTISLDKLNNSVQNSIANGVTAYQRQNAYRGTCSTSMYSNAKDVYCAGLGPSELVAGVVISVYFSNSHVYQENYLNLNIIYKGAGTSQQQSTGYKQVKVGGESISSSNQLLWTANTELTFVYDGTYWQFADAASKIYTTCSTAGATAAKVASASGVVLFRGCTCDVLMTYANTSTSATFNLGSLGAKNLYYGTGTSTRPTVANGKSWLAGCIAPLTFDGQCWRFGTRTYIDGGEIVANSITATQIQAHSITANEINASYMSAIRINASQINAGSISGDRIRGGTIEGTIIKSDNSSTGNKIEVSNGTLTFSNDTDSNTQSIIVSGRYDNGSMSYTVNHSTGTYLTVGSSGVVMHSAITNPSTGQTFSTGSMIRVLDDELDLQGGTIINNLTHRYAIEIDDNGIKMYKYSSSGYTQLARWS